MNSLTNLLRSDRFFSMLVIAISLVLYGAIGNIDDAASQGELATATYPKIILSCLIFFCAVLCFFQKKDKQELAQFSMRGISVIALIALYIALLNTVGYFILTPMLLIALPLIAGFRNYVLIIVSVSLVTAVLYVIFRIVLNIPLPNGFFG